MDVIYSNFVLSYKSLPYLLQFREFSSFHDPFGDSLEVRISGSRAII